jgi:hypothetical protein
MRKGRVKDILPEKTKQVVFSKKYYAYNSSEIRPQETDIYPYILYINLYMFVHTFNDFQLFSLY